MPVNEPDQRVHDQDRIGDAFGEQTEVTEDDGEHTAANTVDHLTHGGGRGGGVVGGHENGAQHHTAGKQGIKHPADGIAGLGEHQGQHSHSAQIGNRNSGRDNLAEDQISTAQKQRQRTLYPYR